MDDRDQLIKRIARLEALAMVQRHALEELELELMEYERERRQLWAQGLAATEPPRLNIVNPN